MVFRLHKLVAFVTVSVLIAVPLFAVEKQQAAGAGTPRVSPAGSLLPTDRFDRPIPMGVSISNTPSLPFIYAGTAGLKVRQFNNPANKFILSNNHVLGAVGPTLCPNSAPVGTWSLQPGTLDLLADPGNDPFYVAGVFVARAPMVPFPTANRADAAISFTTNALAKTEILNIGEPNPAIMAPTVGMTVTKSGRTTGVTAGPITSINLTVLVGYGAGCGLYRFVGQLEIGSSTFSAGGDSGSSILDAATLTPVGLLFAGSPTSTVANDIRWVYQLLGVVPEGFAAASTVEESMRTEDPEMTRLEAIQARHEASLFRLPGVVGVGLSRDSDGWFIKVFASRLTSELRNGVPQSIEGVRVKVFESGEFRAR